MPALVTAVDSVSHHRVSIIPPMLAFDLWTSALIAAGVLVELVQEGQPHWTYSDDAGRFDRQLQYQFALECRIPAQCPVVKRDLINRAIKQLHHFPKRLIGQMGRIENDPETLNLLQ